MQDSNYADRRITHVSKKQTHDNEIFTTILSKGRDRQRRRHTKPFPIKEKRHYKLRVQLRTYLGLKTCLNPQSYRPLSQTHKPLVFLSSNYNPHDLSPIYISMCQRQTIKNNYVSYYFFKKINQLRSKPRKLVQRTHGPAQEIAITSRRYQRQEKQKLYFLERNRKRIKKFCSGIEPTSFKIAVDTCE